MKVIWEEEDIIVGRKFKLPGTNETWIIGYIPTCVGKESMLIFLCVTEWSLHLLVLNGWLVF